MSSSVGTVAAGRGIDARGGVGIGGVPAGERALVVELIVGIPAQHDVAEAEALIERADELVAGEIFSANDPIEIDDAELDVRQAPLLDQGPGIGGGLYTSCVHGFRIFGFIDFMVAENR